jgi:hypothetical protein
MESQNLIRSDAMILTRMGDIMGKSSRTKRDRRQGTPTIERIRIVHTSNNVHLKPGQYVLGIEYLFSSDKFHPEPESMVPITMIEYIGTIDTVAVQIYNTLELVRGACHLYTGMTGYQKSILIFRLVRVNEAFYGPEDSQNAQSQACGSSRRR